MSEASRIRRRNWSDIVAIVAGAWAIAEAVWGPAVFSENLMDASAGYVWLIYATAGALAVASVFLAQRVTGLGRVVLGAAGLLLLVITMVYERPHPLALATGVILAVAMLAATPFMGRIPREYPHRNRERPGRSLTG
jgi:hypothetical protein